MSRKIGVIGSGQVAIALANGFLKHGYEVMVGSREPGKLREWKDKSGDQAQTGTFPQTAEFGEILVLAVAGLNAEEALRLALPENFAGKVVIDATNPIAADPPVNGVLHYFTSLDESLMEWLQKLFPDARFVKAFNSVGNAFMVNPQFPGGPPTMFICGNDEYAKTEVKEILTQFGWETEDMGKVEAARAIEPLAILWCIPGFLRNQWANAFKLLKLN